ncbi:hypothetical protein [Neisseria sp.]|uniref:hypothetical protein n=1 Tax=Neisseria sp. TaxID=192066 RepID=UPI0026DBA51E|nr:hypothetical protein [Neisseria sp.]MDO4226999.1 hypothetical protein [Neisseria sp.]
MRISKTVIILVAVPILALQWIQSRPDIEQKIKTAFSKEQLLEPKFKTKQQALEHDQNKNALLTSNQASSATQNSTNTK